MTTADTGAKRANYRLPEVSLRNKPKSRGLSVARNDDMMDRLRKSPTQDPLEMEQMPVNSQASQLLVESH